MRYIIASLFLWLISAPAYAEHALPASVVSSVRSPLVMVGSGTYHKLGFPIYRAALWAPQNTLIKNKPYVLQLRYTRNLSKDTVYDALLDDIKAQHVADEATLAEWSKTLQKSLPAVKAGDEIDAIAMPGKTATLYLNGRLLTRISDPKLSEAYFNIWFGDTADPDLKAKLLNG